MRQHLSLSLSVPSLKRRIDYNIFRIVRRFLFTPQMATRPTMDSKLDALFTNIRKDNNTAGSVARYILAQWFFSTGEHTKIDFYSEIMSLVKFLQVHFLRPLACIEKGSNSVQRSYT